MITTCDHDHDHHDDDYYYYYYCCCYYPHIIHILSTYYPYIIHDDEYGYQRTCTEMNTPFGIRGARSIHTLPGSCSAPPIGQWSPVTSCANLKLGNYHKIVPSYICIYIYMYIYIHIYIYSIYIYIYIYSKYSISFYGSPTPNISPFWSVKSYIYIYTHTVFLYLHVCSYHIPRTRFVLSPTFQRKENAGQFLAVASRRIFGSAPANFKELTAVTS